MGKECSFDVVSVVDVQEVDNAYQQAKKELIQRYDLKDTGSEIDFDKASKTLTITAPSEFVIKQVIDILQSKLIKRGIELNAVKWGSCQGVGGSKSKRVGTLMNGIEKDLAGTISKDIRTNFPKVKPLIEGDKLRVVSDSKDRLQEVIAFLKDKDYGQPLQYNNYR